jgi:Bacterial Ig domain
MWRWVTRGLVLAFMAALVAPALIAQITSDCFAVGPCGAVDLPDPGRTHSGIVVVRGWFLDPAQVSKVELYVDDQYQHDLVLRLARIDIEHAFPDYPGIHQALPGFQTGFSANRFSNGNHTVELRVYTGDGQVHFLGRRTIFINNSVNQGPIGYIDIPDQSGVFNAAGSFPVNGWAIDTDGIRAIEVLIDGGIIQSGLYGDQRPDVAASYPDLATGMFSGWVANVDTTRIQNGVHLLEVRAVDNQGMSTMLGRRQVQVINNDLFLKPFGYVDEPQRDAVLFGECTDQQVIVSPPVREDVHIQLIRGWALDLGTRFDTGRVSYAEVLVDGVKWLSTDDCGMVFGRLANCYGIPRFDVARAYPTYPDSPRSGFLFTMDVGALISRGVRQGLHNLIVRVGDREGTFADLPTKDGIPVFFRCADDDEGWPSAGFIEFPHNMDYVGGEVVFRGWAVNEQGVSSVQIFVDGVFMGNATYGFPRPDVAEQFPQIFLARNSGWTFTMDTRKLRNERHRLTVRVVNTRGVNSEIGSVDFYTANNNQTP